jgi:hypothetical protein
MKLFDFGVQRCACISSVARMPLEVSIMDALVETIQIAETQYQHRVTPPTSWSQQRCTLTEPSIA